MKKFLTGKHGMFVIFVHVKIVKNPFFNYDKFFKQYCETHITFSCSFREFERFNIFVMFL